MTSPVNTDPETACAAPLSVSGEAEIARLVIERTMHVDDLIAWVASASWQMERR